MLPAREPGLSNFFKVLTRMVVFACRLSTQCALRLTLTHTRARTRTRACTRTHTHTHTRSYSHSQKHIYTRNHRRLTYLSVRESFNMRIRALLKMQMRPRRARNHTDRADKGGAVFLIIVCATIGALLRQDLTRPPLTPG